MLSKDLQGLSSSRQNRSGKLKGLTGTHENTEMKWGQKVSRQMAGLTSRTGGQLLGLAIFQSAQKWARRSPDIALLD